MAINLIVLAITGLLIALVIAWLASPRLRHIMEAPKYRILEWDDPVHFPEAEPPSQGRS